MNNRILNNLKRQLAENKLAKFSIMILVLLIVSTLLAFLSPYDPNKIDILSRLLPPDTRHFFQRTTFQVEIILQELFMVGEYLLP